MEDRWLKLYESALTRYDAHLRWLGEKIRECKSEVAEAESSSPFEWLIITASQKSLAEIEREFEVEISRFKSERNEIWSWVNDPVVYIRNYQPSTVRVYHATLRCGWVVDPRRTRPLLLGEALKMGKRPCQSCGYFASQAA